MTQETSEDRSDKYVDSGDSLWSQCVLCSRLQVPGDVCEAFPVKIPDAINENRWDHREPYPGDQGLGFQLDSKIAGTDELDDDLIRRFFSRL
jgi:hypothetical protein